MTDAGRERGEDHACVILFVASASVATSAAIVVASVLMIIAAVDKKQLRWRTVECPVCHHPRRSCTCRWL